MHVRYRKGGEDLTEETIAGFSSVLSFGERVVITVIAKPTSSCAPGVVKQLKLDASPSDPGDFDRVIAKVQVA